MPAITSASWKSGIMVAPEGSEEVACEAQLKKGIAP